MIRDATKADARQICDIYNYYIENTNITFEVEPLLTEEIAARITRISSAYPYLVCEKDGYVAGYAYAGPWKDRAAYLYSSEISVYLKSGSEGIGIGSALMEALLAKLRRTNLRCIISGITIPNDRSIALHEKYGFKKIGQFPQVGYKNAQWLDVGYWALNL